MGLIRRIALAAVASTACTAPPAAGELQREGRYDVTTCWSTELNHAKDHTGRHTR